MAQRTQLIYSDNPGDLPATYTLPPGLDLELAAVRLRVAGAGAAAPFLAVLEVLSSSGQIMAQAPSRQTFAVGDTGVVTFAPF